MSRWNLKKKGLDMDLLLKSLVHSYISSDHVLFPAFSGISSHNSNESRAWILHNHVF